jgi:large subunit ribosomal protein L24
MSKQPRKQRKALYTAPLHARHKNMKSTLSKDLRKEIGKRSLPLRAGDKVKVLRGDFKDHEGKVLELNYTSYKVTVEEVTLSKSDGTAIFYPIDPSNLMIIKADLDDERRIKNVKGE